MDFLCIVCSKEVRRQQHAFQCDGCDKWQHRTCNTGKLLYEFLKRLSVSLSVRPPARPSVRVILVS